MTLRRADMRVFHVLSVAVFETETANTVCFGPSGDRRDGQPIGASRAPSVSRMIAHTSRSAASSRSISSSVTYTDGSNRSVFTALDVGKTRTRCSRRMWPATK